MNLKLTPTEQILFDALADGEAHRPQDLITLLGDELMDRTALKSHLHNLRRKLRPTGEDILAQSYGRRIGYRRVILITTANKPGS